MKTMISIDWDFFLWRGYEAKEAFIETVRGPIHADQLFDWGNSEGHSAELQQFLWMTRYSGLVACGLKPEEIAGFRDPHPLAFASHLASRLPAGPLGLLLADSHAVGFRAARMAFEREGQEPVHVLHFDAHHDLGYRGVQQQKRSGHTDCGAWLWHAMDRGLVSGVTVVYPDWRSDGDWAQLLKAPHMRRFKERVHSTRWGAWRQEHGPLDVSVINVARSSAWTPPWFDLDFQRFVGAIPASSRCLDCEADTPGGHDACVPREWDAQQAQALSLGTQGVFRMAQATAEQALAARGASETMATRAS